MVSSRMRQNRPGALLWSAIAVVVAMPAHAQVTTLTPTQLPAATVNQDYAINVSFRNPFAPQGCLDARFPGLPPGFLPDDGLGFACNLGDLAGTTPNHPAQYTFGYGGRPSTAGTFPVSVRVFGRCNTPGCGPTTDQTFTFSLKVNPAPPPPLQITTSSPLPQATAGQNYSVTFAATGGDGSYFWSILDPLPGSSIYLQGSPNVSFTPSSAGDFSFRMKVESAGASVTKQFSIHVQGPACDSAPNAPCPAMTLTLSVTPDVIDLPVNATTAGQASCFFVGGCNPVMSPKKDAGKAVVTVEAKTSAGPAAGKQVSLLTTVQTGKGPHALHMTAADAETLAADYSNKTCQTQANGTCTIEIKPAERPNGNAIRPVALTLLLKASAVDSTGQQVVSEGKELTMANRALEPLVESCTTQSTGSFRCEFEQSQHVNLGQWGDPILTQYLRNVVQRLEEAPLLLKEECKFLPLTINGMSLKDGGHFDVDRNFTGDHVSHQAGNDVDIRTRHLSAPCRTYLDKVLDGTTDPFHSVAISYPALQESPVCSNPVLDPTLYRSKCHWHVRIDLTGKLLRFPPWEGTSSTTGRKPTEERMAIAGSPLQVSLSVSGGSYSYGYTLTNSVSTSQSLETLQISFTGSPSNTVSPAGWQGGVLGNRQGVSWGAVALDALPAGWVDLGGSAPSTASLKPAGQLAGFSYQSNLPPVVAPFLTRTYRALPSFLSESEIERDTGTPPPAPASFRGFTIAPRAAATDARAVLNDLINQIQFLASSGWINAAASQRFTTDTQAAISALASPAQVSAALTAIMNGANVHRGSGANEEAWAIVYYNAQYAQTLPAAAGCSFSLDPPGLTLNGAPKAFTIHIKASSSSCSWSAASPASWVTLVNPSGTGSGDLSLLVPLTAISRSTTLNIAGLSFSLVQKAGLTITEPTPSARFVAVQPCRVIDTRAQTAGPLQAGETRAVPVANSPCLIPLTAEAYSLNMTVVPKGPVSYLSAWPTGRPKPLVSTLNSFHGGIVANAAIVPAGQGGSINVFVTDPTDVVIDINGYFDSTAGLPFYPVAPCRIADTRGAPGLAAGFSTPSLSSNATRSFPMPLSNCALPANAGAYSVNVTVVPGEPLGYLTLWPTGGARPLVSTLNSPDGRILANAAIVPAGSGGAISAFVTNRTDVIFDVNGYFGAPGAGALAFHRLTPCRVADTRPTEGFLGSFGPPSMTAGSRRDFPLPLGSCGIPEEAKAYSLNVTVVPKGPLSFLTLWPAGGAQPFVSTLNALKGNILANAALVPAGVNGSISVYATDATDVIVDVNGYFSTQ